VIICDESWFLLHYPNESAWAESQDKLPVRVKQTIDAEKCLVSVLWSVNETNSLVYVPKGESDNSAFFCNVVAQSLVESICSQSRRRSLKDLYVHLDNARPHSSRQPNDCLQAIKAPWMAQPACSPDAAPSHFFPFGLPKQQIQGFHFSDRETLKSARCRIFNGIDREVFISVFLDWIERLERVIENNRE
jgi:hypothetical protein